MRILFFTDNFPPELNAPATRTYEHALEWVKNGAEVTVITSAPNFPRGKVFKGYKNKLYQKETIDGIKVIRVWTYIALNRGLKRRTLDYISYATTSFFASLFVKTDIIIATSPQFFTAMGGSMAAFFKRKPWIMEVRDIWPESIKAVGALRRPRLLNLLEKIELRLYRHSKRVVVVTDSFKENLSSRGVPLEKIKIIKNGVHQINFQPQEKDQNLINELGLKDKFVVTYLGTHGMAHKLDFILDSIKDVDKNIHFLFIGGGGEKPNLIQQAMDLRLKNVTMLGFVPKTEIKSYISITDVALVPLRKSDTFKTVIPSKIFENAAMQKPILLGVEGEAKAIITKYEAGLCFEPENKSDFIRQLMKMYNDSESYNHYKNGCTSLAKDFDRKQLAQIFLSEINDTLNEETNHSKQKFQLKKHKQCK